MCINYWFLCNVQFVSKAAVLYKYLFEWFTGRFPRSEFYLISCTFVGCTLRAAVDLKVDEWEQNCSSTSHETSTLWRKSRTEYTGPFLLVNSYWKRKIYFHFHEIWYQGLFFEGLPWRLALEYMECRVFI